MDEDINQNQTQAKSPDFKKPNNLKWGCIAVLGLIGLILVFSFICQPSDSLKLESGHKGNAPFLLNNQGTLIPGEQNNFTVNFEQGKIAGELFGFNNMFNVKIQRISDNTIIPCTVVSERQVYTRLQWDIPETGSYVVYITNMTGDTKTDYILKIWKGNYKQ